MTDVAAAPFSGPPDCSAHRVWPWHARIASAAHRRFRAWCRTLGSRDHRQVIDRAVGSLSRRASLEGVADRPGAPACPGLTAAILPTLLTFGQIDAARQLSAWLLSTQRPDGGFPRAGADAASLFNTAQTVAALVELETAEIMVAPDAARRAATYLDMRLASETSPGDMGRQWHAIRMSLVPSLIAAAERFDVPKWRRTAQRVAARARGAVDGHSWTGLGRLFTQAVEAWIVLGELDLARDALNGPAVSQEKSGALAGNAAGTWGDNGLLAHLAFLWYQLGERERANRALRFLATQQFADGGWSQYWRRDIKAAESVWVAKHYLDAAWLQSTSVFNQTGCQLPQAIDPRDGRFRAVHEWLASFGGIPRVADVGCGPGRFLRELAPQFPAARLVGIDPSAALLERIPASVEARRGGLLRIPAVDNEFDGVFAVESLEHSLLPERAVREICRVVRPGGRVLIIDKHLARQALSLHEPWERWFLPETVVGWLTPHCRDVCVRPIPHGADEAGLFLCWEGTKAA